MNKNKNKSDKDIFYDTENWKITSFSTTIREVMDKYGNITELKTRRVTKKKTDGINLDELEKWFSRFKSREIKPVYQERENGNLLVIPIVDLHWNMLTTKFISGDDYNKDIATELFNQIISETINRSKKKDIEKIWLVIGNDLFNADGISGQTFKGTQQCEEGHFFEAYTKLVELIINGTETLYKKLKAPIEIVFVPSNHDKTAAWHLVFNLNTYFRNNANVINVDISPLPRKYKKYGSTLFMFSHDIKRSIPVGQIVLNEAQEYLPAKYIEVLLCHLHSEKVKNDGNITVRRLPTISANSTWANDEGYSSNRQHLSFIYSKDGIEEIMYIRA